MLQPKDLEHLEDQNSVEIDCKVDILSQYIHMNITRRTEEFNQIKYVQKLALKTSITFTLH